MVNPREYRLNEALKKSSYRIKPASSTAVHLFGYSSTYSVSSYSYPIGSVGTFPVYSSHSSMSSYHHGPMSSTVSVGGAGACCDSIGPSRMWMSSQAPF